MKLGEKAQKEIEQPVELEVRLKPYKKIFEVNKHLNSNSKNANIINLV